MKKYSKLAFYSCFLVCLFAGCKSSTEQIPSYIHVSGVKLAIDTVKYGTSSTKVTDVWVTANNTFLGGYQMPVTFPVLESGTKQLILQPGIMIDDISTTRAPYPFFEPFSIDLNMLRGRIDTITPVIKYKTSTKVAFIEGFEGTFKALKPESANSSTITYINQKDSVFSGSYALKSALTQNGNKFLISSPSYTFNRGGQVWVELNYKNTIGFEVDIETIVNSSTTQVPIVGFEPTGLNKWNKVYINLSDKIADITYGNTIKVQLYSVLPSGNPDARIFIDNVKLLYFDN